MCFGKRLVSNDDGVSFSRLHRKCLWFFSGMKTIQLSILHVVMAPFTTMLFQGRWHARSPTTSQCSRCRNIRLGATCSEPSKVSPICACPLIIVWLVQYVSIPWNAPVITDSSGYNISHSHQLQECHGVCYGCFAVSKPRRQPKTGHGNIRLGWLGCHRVDTRQTHDPPVTIYTIIDSDRV